MLILITLYMAAQSFMHTPEPGVPGDFYGATLTASKPKGDCVRRVCFTYPDGTVICGERVYPDTECSELPPETIKPK